MMHTRYFSTRPLIAREKRGARVWFFNAILRRWQLLA